MKIKKILSSLFIIIFIVIFTSASANTSAGMSSAEYKIKNDTHYTTAGFFDLHVCNWPDKKLFFLAVFSTYKYKKIESVEVYRPDGSRLGVFNLKIAKSKITKNKKLKHIAISKFPAREKEKNGWYKAIISLKSGQKIVAKDFIKIKKMPIADKVSPENSLTAVDIPKSLNWGKIEGAAFYKVTIRDMWNDGAVAHTSKLLKENHYNLPKGLIKSGGWYEWRVHARDVNEDVLLGDFNHGSLNKPAVLLTKE